MNLVWLKVMAPLSTHLGMNRPIKLGSSIQPFLVRATERAYDSVFMFGESLDASMDSHELVSATNLGT